MIEQDVESKGWQQNLAGLFCAQALLLVAFTIFLPFLPLYVKTMGVQDDVAATQWAGFIAAAGSVSAIFAQPLWGHISDRYGRKPIVIFLLLASSITTLAMGFATSPEQLLVAQFLQGVTSGAGAACAALAATSAPKRQLGFALGALQVSWFLGTSIGPLIGGVIGDFWGFREAYYAAGALMILGAIITFGLVRENFIRPVPGEHMQSFWKQSRALFAIAAFSTMTMVIFLTQLAMMIVSPMLSLFIADLSGSENAATATGIVYAATGAVCAISALTIGRLIDRFNPRTMLLVCLLGAALSYFPQALVEQVWQLLALRIAFGVFLGGMMPIANTLVARAVRPAQQGAAFGITNAASSAAFALAPIGGLTFVTFWGMRSVFLVTGALFVLTYGWVIISSLRSGSVSPDSTEQV